MRKTGLVWSGRLAKSKLKFSQRSEIDPGCLVWFGMMYFSLYTEFTLVAADCYWMLKQTRCMYSRALHCTAAHSESDEEWRVEYFIVADLLFPVIKRSPHSMDSVCNSFNRQRVIRNGGAEKYEIWKRRKSEEQSCSSNQASAVQAKKRQVLAGFLPYSAHFFCIFTLSTHIQNQFCKKNQVWLAFFGRGGGSKFLPQLREGCHRLLNWQIQISKSWK